MTQHHLEDLAVAQNSVPAEHSVPVEPDISEWPIAERLFAGTHAECQLEEQLYDTSVPYEKLGWDYYDCSLELYGVADDYRLPPDVQKIIFDAGFIKVYVNHVNKWETHYTWSKDGFAAVPGWRVCYPHRRGPDEKGIWVEEHIATWPQEWFEIGYVTIVRATEAEPSAGPDLEPLPNNQKGL